MPITIKGVFSSIKQMEKDIGQQVESELRKRALLAFGEVKLRTPVDTGRARNSWYIGYLEQYHDAIESAPQITILSKKNKPTEIIVTNGVEYIKFLNDGSSQQAPTKFIESAFSRYFDSVQITYK